MDYFNTIGYVFQPNPEEILTTFLPRRLANEPIGSPPDLYSKLVKEIDLYEPNKEPSEIFLNNNDDHQRKDNIDNNMYFYFFTRVKPVGTKSGREVGKKSHRTAGKGTWRAEKPEDIGAMFVDSNGEAVETIIGTKRLYKYILSPKEEAKKNEKNSNVIVSWIMHEYRMNLGADNPLSVKVKLENHDIVFCCVRKYSKYVKSKRAISLVDNYAQDCYNNVAKKSMVVPLNDYVCYDQGNNYNDPSKWNVYDQENVGMSYYHANNNNEVKMIEGVTTMRDRQMVVEAHGTDDQLLVNMELSEEIKTTISELVHVSLEGENEDGHPDWTSSAQDHQFRPNHGDNNGNNGWGLWDYGVNDDVYNTQDQNCFSMNFTDMLTAP